MISISIISSSIRNGRNSHRVALFFFNYLRDHNLAIPEILDLEAYNFPLFTERLLHQSSPPSAALAFAEKVRSSEGIIMVVPEYNGGYPASLKNAIDLLTTEWHRKPVALATVSDGGFGGTQVITSLQFILWKMRAWTIPAVFPVARVHESFDIHGIPHDKEATDRRAGRFVQELLWCAEANRRMKV